MICRSRANMMLRSCMLLFLVTPLTGCLMMLAKGGVNLSDNPSVASTRHGFKKQPQRAHIYTMRGWLGIFSQGMDELAQKVESELGYDAKVMSYHEKDKLIKHITHAYESGQLDGDIILVGHSFGADAQMDVARALDKYHIPVKLLIAIEPTRKKVIPKNVNHVYQLASGTSLPKRVLGWGQDYDKTNILTTVEKMDLTKGDGAEKMHHFNMTTYPKTLKVELDLIKQVLKPQHIPQANDRAHG